MLKTQWLTACAGHSYISSQTETGGSQSGQGTLRIFWGDHQVRPSNLCQQCCCCSCHLGSRSVCLYVGLSVYVYVCWSVCPSGCWSVTVSASVCLLVCLLCLLVCHCLTLSICLLVYPSVCWSVTLTHSLPAGVSIGLGVCLCFLSFSRSHCPLACPVPMLVFWLCSIHPVRVRNAHHSWWSQTVWADGDDVGLDVLGCWQVGMYYTKGLQMGLSGKEWMCEHLRETKKAVVMCRWCGCDVQVVLSGYLFCVLSASGHCFVFSVHQDTVLCSSCFRTLFCVFSNLKILVLQDTVLCS